VFKDIHLNPGLLRIVDDGSNRWALHPESALHAGLIMETDVSFPVSVSVEKGATLGGDSTAIVRRYALGVVCGVDTDSCVPICNCDGAGIDIAVTAQLSLGSIGPNRGIEGIFVEFFGEDGSAVKTTRHPGHAADSCCQDTES
jgi:hypothetical protein